MYETSDFRNGLKIEYDNQPYVIVEFQHVKPGKGNAFTRTRIRNLQNGRTLTPTFKSGEKVKVPDVEEKTMTYLYPEGDSCAFMDTTNYEQAVTIVKSALGDQARFLKENVEVSGGVLERPPDHHRPAQPPQFEGDRDRPGLPQENTATGSSKPATLETGTQINVPVIHQRRRCPACRHPHGGVCPERVNQ